MARDRARNPVIPESLAKQLTYICMVCSKEVEGFYGQHQDGGTCSRSCEKEQMSRPRYPGHSETEFFNRLGETP